MTSYLHRVSTINLNDISGAGRTPVEHKSKQNVVWNLEMGWTTNHQRCQTNIYGVAQYSMHFVDNQRFLQTLTRARVRRSHQVLRVRQNHVSGRVTNDIHTISTFLYKYRLMQWRWWRWWRWWWWKLGDFRGQQRSHLNVIVQLQRKARAPYRARIILERIHTQGYQQRGWMKVTNVSHGL